MSSSDHHIPWNEVELGDIVTLHRGYDLPSAQRHTGAVPVVSSSGITGYHDEPKVQPPGVVTGRYGTLGEVFFVDEPFWPLNTTLFVSDFHGNDERFVSYFLRCAGLGAHDGAAAVPGINRNVLHRLPARRPPLQTQRKIAAVLSAYDSLIENNRRRIQCLEETAQRIYREWFVDFRYPGHEDVRMMNSELGLMPEGWNVRAFSDLGVYVNGFAFKPADWGTDGPPIIKIRELKNGVTDDTPRFDGNLPAKYVISDGDLLFSWSAHLDAYLWTGGTAWLNQHLFRVDALDDIPTAFLFHALRERMGEFRSLSQGTTMRHIKRSALSQVMSVIPPPSLRHQFAEFVEPIDGLALALVRETQNSRETRDLLLPRLVSGELVVANMDIGVPDLAA